MLYLLLLSLFAFSKPNDAMFDKSWGLLSTTFTGLKVDRAWNYSKGSKEVVVAIVDSGVDTNHPDLKDNIWINSKETPSNGIDDDGNGYVDDIHGYDFYRGSSNISDANGHGTHIAGIIGATCNNKIGTCGVSPKVRLMILNYMKPTVRSLSNVKRNREDYAQNIALAIKYAADNGADIINLSISGPYPYKAEEEAIKYAGEKGTLVVVASGNNRQDTDEVRTYPANYLLDNIISVAAVDSNGRLPYFSNFGKSTVDLLAPGVDIISTMPEGKYDKMSGTSQATAFVSGVAALVKAENPTADYKVLKERLLSSISANPYFLGKTKSSGNLNALMALMPKKSLLEESGVLSSSGFTDEEGNIIKDTSCVLCAGSRILCGKVDQEVQNYEGEDSEKLSIAEVCAKKNQKLESKENLNSLHESEITYYSLRGEIFSMAASEEDKKLLLENGFLLSDLIKNLGWEAYNKLRSIYMLVPVLNENDFKKYGGDKSNISNHYTQYLEDLINSPSPYLEHKGYGLFRYTVYSSPVIIERISNLMPIDRFMMLDKVNFSKASSYKVGKSSAKDKDLVKASLKALDMPAIKDLKEARKQVYLKLNEHHLSEDQLGKLVPKKHANNKVLKNHISSVMSDPVTFMPSSSGSRLRSGGRASNASSGAGEQARNHEEVLGQQRVKASQAEKELKKLPTNQAIKREQKALRQGVSKTLSYKSIQEQKGQGESARDFVRKRPSFVTAARQKNLAYMKAPNIDATSTSEQVAKDYKKQKRKMSSGGRPRAYSILSAPMLSTTRARTRTRTRNHGNATNRAKRSGGATKNVKAPAKPKAEELLLDKRLDAPMETLRNEKKGPPAIRLENIGDNIFQNSQISCESMQWQQLVYQLDEDNPFLKEQDCFPERPVDICGKTRRAREYTKKCVSDDLKPASCFDQIHLDVANICNQYVDLPRNYSQDDLLKCAETMFALTCKEIPCELFHLRNEDGKISALGPDITKVIEINLNSSVVKQARRGNGYRLKTYEEIMEIPHVKMGIGFTHKAVARGSKVEFKNYLKKDLPSFEDKDFFEDMSHLILFYNEIPNRCEFQNTNGGAASEGKY